MDEVIGSSKFSNSENARYPHGWIDNYGKNDWEYRTLFVQEKNQAVWEVVLNVTTTASGQKILYDINGITMKKAGQSVKSDTSTANDSVSHKNSSVNHYSMQHSKNNSSNRQYSVDSDNKKITVNMSDSERAEILKSKILVVPIYDGSADNVIAMNEQYLKSNKSAFIRNTLKRIGTEFGVFTKYNIEDIDLTVELSNNSIEKTANEYYVKK